MKNLIIIGARGFGREVFGLATACEGFKVDFIVKGFLDDKADALQGFKNYPQIISTVENYEVQENDVFTCALGSIAFKKYYVESILAKGGIFKNLIHPSVLLNLNVKLGFGNIIFGNTIISNDVEIDNFVTIQPFVGIGHDSKIKSWCTINAFSFMGGFVILEEEVCLNTRATILPKVKINRGATVGATSLVIKNVKANTTVFGTPAKILNF